MRKCLLSFFVLLCPLLAGAGSLSEDQSAYLSRKDGLSSDHVHCVLQDQRGFLWIGTDAGLDLYDGQMVQTFPYPCLSLSESGGKIWAGTHAGIYAYDPADGSLSMFRETTKYGVNIVSAVKSILVTDETTLWAGTQGQGVFIYNLITGTLDQHSISTPFVERIVKGPDGRIMVGTSDGSLALYSADGDFIKFTDGHLPARRDTLKDNGGTLWIPTADRGLLKIPRKDAGTLFYPYPEHVSASSTVAPMTEDDEGNIYIGLGHKLYVLRAGAASITPQSAASFAGAITSLMYVSGEIWCGTDSAGLYRYNLSFHRSKHYPINAAVNVICRLANGEILLGTEMGVFSYNPVQDSLEPQLNRKDIRIILNGERSASENLVEFEVVTQSSALTMAEDGMGHLYMASSDRGFFRKDLMKGNWEHIVNTRSGERFIPGTKVTSLSRNPGGGLWAGTAGEGLWHLPKDSLTFTRFKLRDHRLDGQTLSYLSADGNGGLWISTPLGIWCLNPRSGALTPYHVKFGQLLYSTGGKMYVSQKDALVSIDPSLALRDNELGNVVIRDVSVGDSTIFIPPGGREIILPYAKNSFSIRLARLNFASPSKHLYSWRLKGMDPAWTPGGSLNIASYANVPPGKYTFEVEESSDVLRLVIRPPWWRTKAAIAAWILLALSSVTFAIFFWQRGLKRRYDRMMKEQNEEKEKELYKSRIRFFIGLVHEIRTPLTLIRLQHEKDAPGANDSITRNLDYMQGTINRILSYNKNTSDGVEMLLTRVDLGSFSEGVLDNFRSSGKAKGISASLSIPETPVYVNADEDHLQKILNNLLSNALKYARERVSVKVSVSGDEAMLAVEDDGPGVRQQQREKIFEMFYTDPEDSIAQSSGMGVGLAYSMQLAKAHGGTITVGDSVLGGAAFALHLPLMKEEVAQDALAPSAQTASGITVLVAEDNLELLETLRDDLSPYYQIITAPDGKKAWDQLEEVAVDIVVSDVMMPVMDGLELCRRIKADVAYSHIPVILLTAKVSLPDKTEGMESGADAYVEKPFSIRQLKGQIDNLIHLREAVRKALTEGAALQEASLPRAEVDFMKAIDTAIEKQIAEESFSIEALAYDMAMSRTNFFRKFKALTGGTPNEYLKNYRLNRAAQLIRDGARINEAAFQAGFTSSSYFAKCFKARFGVLPKDYQKTDA